MEPVISFFQENAAAIIILAVILLPLGYIFRKYTVPFILHSIEFFIYVSIMHVSLTGIVRVFSWFRAQTQFKNMDGSLDESFTPLFTPLYNHVWDRSAYSPEWLFYVELVLVAMTLYVVAVLRPTRFGRGKNKFKGDPNKGYEKGATYDRSRSVVTRTR